MNISLPPLRERKEDIPLLVEHFVNTAGYPHAECIRVNREVIEAFNKYDWPGNVRELSNVLERAIILSNNNFITLKEIPHLNQANTDTHEQAAALLSLNEIEKRHIGLVLEAQSGNKTRAARILGISRPKLYRKMLKYGIADTTTEMVSPD
jgi:two-component system NtrC family response regulator